MAFRYPGRRFLSIDLANLLDFRSLWYSSGLDRGSCICPYSRTCEALNLPPSPSNYNSPNSTKAPKNAGKRKSGPLSRLLNSGYGAKQDQQDPIDNDIMPRLLLQSYHKGQRRKNQQRKSDEQMRPYNRCYLHPFPRFQ